VEFQRKCLGKMGDVANDGRTVLFVSHNMGSVKQLCDNGIFLLDGKIHYKGSINDCIDMYLNTSLTDSTSILSHLTSNHKGFLIQEVLVNGQNNDTVNFLQEDETLKIEVFGEVESPSPVDLEVHIKDTLGNPLAFYSPGHKNGNIKQVDSGRFTLSWVIHLPNNMLRGDYLLDISLTNPNKARWATLNNAVRLSVEGVQTMGDRFIEYRSGAGWLILD